MKNWLKSLIFAALLTFATEAAKGQVYTANYGNSTVSKITSAGVLTAAWATLTSGAYSYAIAIDASGNVYTANSGNSTVSKITSAGVLTAAWATLTSGAAPYAIAVISASTVEPFLLLPPVIP